MITSFDKEFLEQVTGIEPASDAWEAPVLPLNYTCESLLIILPFSLFVKSKFSSSHILFSSISRVG